MVIGQIYRLVTRVCFTQNCITESNIRTTRCVSWDFNLRDGIGDWSEEGCEFVNFTSDEHVVCYCYHLTNFAAIAVSAATSCH